MTLKARFQTVWQSLVESERSHTVDAVGPVVPWPEQSAGSVEIAPNDPIIAYFQDATGAVDIDRLNLDSPAARALKEAGVKLAVPLISQNELIGVLNLGPPLDGRDYSADDRRLLHDLATQASPAVRVAQLVREQQQEAQSRERLEQELRVAQVIQQTLLPKELPSLPGWSLARYYQPAREVGGDFYDFIQLPDGKMALVVGDVTDKGVPAAMVMATTRAILHGAAETIGSPGEVLRRVNDLLQPDIPPKMFVTCLYAVLEPDTGRLVYANAGHNLPCLRCGEGISELRATGMPLGLMPGMTYEESETYVQPGDSILFYSDGLVEAHNNDREMFGIPRLRGLLAGHTGGEGVIDYLLDSLSGLTGAGWEQEDDVTMVTLQRSASIPSESHGSSGYRGATPEDDDEPRTLAEFSIPSQPGNERDAADRVAAAVAGLALSGAGLDRLKTAVAEATMNAMEHGNRYISYLPVSIQVLASSGAVLVRVSDHGPGSPVSEAEQPDLEAKLEGTQSPRGWGLFLIKNMVDDVRITGDETHHTVELVVNIGEER